MKYVKMLGLLAVAAAALMAFAGSASATTLTGPSGETTPTIHAVSEGHVTLANPIANISCSSTVEGTVDEHGAASTAGGPISSLSFTGCTNGWHVTVIAAGRLQIHWLKPGHGTITSSGATVDTTRLGVTCLYVTNNTDIGTLTDSTTPEGPTVHIKAKIPVHSGSSGLCGTGEADWEGTYKLTKELTIDE